MPRRMSLLSWRGGRCTYSEMMRGCFLRNQLVNNKENTVRAYKSAISYLSGSQTYSIRGSLDNPRLIFSRLPMRNFSKRTLRNSGSPNSYRYIFYFCFSSHSYYQMTMCHLHILSYHASCCLRKINEFLTSPYEKNILKTSKFIRTGDRSSQHHIGVGLASVTTNIIELQKNWATNV